MKMKSKLFALIAAIALTTTATQAFDIKGLLKGAASAAGSNDSNVNSALGIIGGILGKTDVTLEQLEGTWQYAGPAVAFQSDNLLQRAGGIAAAQTIEKKLTTYYNLFGVSSMKITFTRNGEFSLSVGGIPVKGTIEKGSDGNFVFAINGLGMSNATKISSIITSSGSNIDMTFDATKVMEIATKLLSATKNSTLNTASSLLGSYDGMNIGFKLSKCKTK